MRHRMGGAAATGFGNSSEPLIDGKKTKNSKINKLVNACAKDAYLIFFKGTKLDQGYCDAQYRSDEIRVGIEPAYQYEELKVLTINKEKGFSRFLTGQSMGAYGSAIRESSQYYKEYTRDCKFIRFIDKWHPKVFKAKGRI